MDVLSQSTIINELVELLIRLRKYRTVVNYTGTSGVIAKIALPIVQSSYQKALSQPPSMKITNLSEWRKNGVIDREWDLPASIREESCWLYKEIHLEWYKNGKKHRDNDLPAIISTNIMDTYNKLWYKDGLQHRDNDQPAVMVDGTLMWYQYGQQHRDNDKPCAIYPDGSKHWCKCGKLYKSEPPR